MNKIITCTLQYLNENLHVGHFFEATCADIKSIFLKDQKKSHYFISGDDCHGAATTIFCEQNNLDIEEHIQKQHKEHKNSYDCLGIEFSNFSKTNSQLHHQVVNWSIEQIIDNSKKLNVEFFSTKKVLSWFDDEKQQFLPDRYVKGKCGSQHKRNENSADNHRLAYKESLGACPDELKNKANLMLQVVGVSIEESMSL